MACVACWAAAGPWTTLHTLALVVPCNCVLWLESGHLGESTPHLLCLPVWCGLLCTSEPPFTAALGGESRPNLASLLAPRCVSSHCSHTESFARPCLTSHTHWRFTPLGWRSAATPVKSIQARGPESQTGGLHGRITTRAVAASRTMGV